MPFSAVLLAAGRASRLGEPKGLVEVQGIPWLAWQLVRLARASVPRAVVVVGANADVYRQKTGNVMECCRRLLLSEGNILLPDLEIVENPTPDNGPFSSLQVGLRALGAESCFVLPVDTPTAEPEVWAALESSLRLGSLAAVPRWNPGLGEVRGGHPVALGAPLVQQIVSMDVRSSNARLDRILLECEACQVSVSDARVAFNLNTRAEWSQLGALTLKKGSLKVRPRERASAICVRDGHLLMLKMRDPISLSEAFFPPGGAIERSETPIEAALRELHEETGYEGVAVSHPSVVRSYFFGWAEDVIYCRTHFVGVAVCSESEPPFVPDDPALVERVWIPLENLPETLGGSPAILEAVQAVIRS